MGMAGRGTGMGGMAGMSHGAMGGMDHGSMSMRDPANAPPDMKVGVGVDMVAAMPQDRTGHPGLGLENVGHRVLTYRDLVALTPNRATRPPQRVMEIHLTGHMESFMWEFDGRNFSEGEEPIRIASTEWGRVGQGVDRRGSTRRE